MKNIKLLRISLKNFRCFKDKEVNFDNDVTTISGMNGVGKSTLYEAMLWVLFEKTAQNASTTDIRPHDKQGNEIDNIDIECSCLFEVDGKEIELKKIQKQKWVKKRGSQSVNFEGNVTEYYVNDIPKRKKDYTEVISDNFCSNDMFMFLTNAQSFFSLNQQKRRDKLMELVSEVTDRDVIDRNPEFLELSDSLDYGTVEELIKKSKSTIRKLKKEQDVLPARIDEQDNSRQDIAFSQKELEEEKEALKRQLEDIRLKKEDVSSQYVELQKESDKMFELQLEINSKKQKVYDSIVQEMHKYERLIKDIEYKIKDVKRETDRLQLENKNDTNKIGVKKDTIKALSSKWKKEKALQMDESELVCPYCGREYDKEKQEEVKKEYEQKKQKLLDDISSDGFTFKNQIKELEEKIESRKKLIVENDKEYEKLVWESTKYESTIHELDAGLQKDIHTDEIDKMKKQLEEMRKAELKSCDQEVALKEVRSKLDKEEAKIRTDIETVDNQLMKVKYNKFIDERIEELRQEQRQTAQKVADEERMLDLLESFNRKKMDVLTDEINKHFKLVKWNLFENQINGGYKDVCQAVVNGSNYETCLNNGHKILANIDILETFQRVNEIKLPIFVDNAEGLNDFNLPKVGTQMILLKVSDNKRMEVE